MILDPWKRAVLCTLVALVMAAAWLHWSDRPSPTVGNGPYTVEFVWDHGSTTARLAGRSAKLHLDSSLRDLILKEAEKVVADQLPMTGFSRAEGYLELTVLGPTPAFVEIHKFQVTQPDILQIMAAVEREDIRELRRLISLSQNVNVKQPPAWRTPLYTAAAGNHPKSVEVLVELGADPNIADINGSTALSAASMSGNAKTIQQLVHAGAGVNSPGPAGLTPMMLAAEKGHVEAVRALLAAGADPNLRTPSGETALTLAQKNGQERVVKLLREARSLW